MPSLWRSSRIAIYLTAVILTGTIAKADPWISITPNPIVYGGMTTFTLNTLPTGMNTGFTWQYRAVKGTDVTNWIPLSSPQPSVTPSLLSR